MTSPTMQLDTPPSVRSAQADSSGTETQSCAPSPNLVHGECIEESVTKKSVQRRAHRKSRSGCKQCKRRRVKCDERKPECSSCRSRHIRCDYLSAVASSIANTPGYESNNSAGSISAPSFDLSVLDIELMYHWTTFTCYSLAAGNKGATYWKQDVTEIGLANRYVLRLILAFTALHLAYSRPARREEYAPRADEHYAAAMPVLTAELSHLNQDNCDAVLIAAQLVIFLNWAQGPRPGEYLAFGTGRSDWLTIFRGIRTTIETLGPAAFSKHASSLRSRGKPLPPADPSIDYQQPLDELREYVTYNSLPLSLPINLHSLDTLIELYNSRYCGDLGEYHVIFAWLYRMREEFLEAVQRHDAVPLVIYAHFVVLMYELERFWYLKGWSTHVLSGIWEVLRDEDRICIRWPCAVVGWIPPT